MVVVSYIYSVAHGCFLLSISAKLDWWF